jgi:hypothetical protein
MLWVRVLAQVGPKTDVLTNFIGGLTVLGIVVLAVVILTIMIVRH